MIKLTCTNCGGKLELKPETEQFACGYCGTEFLVERGGGIVSLKRVEEGLDKVAVHTGEIVQELKQAKSQEAILREEELREKARSEINSRKNRILVPGIIGIVLGIVFLWISLSTMNKHANYESKINRWPKLHQAVFDNNIEEVKTLLAKKVSINHKTEDGATPLHFAIVEKRYEIAEMLLKAGADPNVEYYGRNAFSWASTDKKMSEILEKYKNE